jgi:putative alpha-1,2-mannosidase
VRSLRFDGRAYRRPWTTYCALARGAALSFRLGQRPNRRWGAASPPPSFGPRRPMPSGPCRP